MKVKIAAILVLININISYSQVILNANGLLNTYERITSFFAPGYGVSAVEAPDLYHPWSAGRHIADVFDSELNKYVFEFYSHALLDNEPVDPTLTDRQRVEIKTYAASPDNFKGTVGENIIYKWQFKIQNGFKPSSNFTHLHQIKAVDGDDSTPLFTLTPRLGTPNKLELIYAATSTSGADKVRTVDLLPFEGIWIDAEEIIKVGSAGSYSLTLKKHSDGTVLLSYSNANIATIRPDNTFIRPKWGIYRSLNDVANLRDEAVRFSDFSITEVIAPTASAQNFCISSNPTVANLVATGTLLKWYANQTGGTELAANTNLVTATYYVSQTLDGIESSRTSVSVTVNSNSSAAVKNVSSIEALQTAISTANCGDIIVLANGHYNNATLNINTSNITIKAATSGGVYLDGANDININGNYIKFIGFQFTSGDIGPNYLIRVFGNYNTVSQLNFGGYRAKKFIEIAPDTQYNIVEYCNISKLADDNIDELGCAIQIRTSFTTPGYHKIRYCSFQNFGGAGGDYGNEPIRIGLSTENANKSRSIVEHCYFNNTGLGDSESVSIKSQENTIRFCTFTNQQNAMLVFRNGDNNVAYSNFFINAGGIRVKEANNIYCYNNYFENSGSTNGAFNADAVTYIYDTTTYPVVLNNINFVHNTFYNCADIDFGGVGPTNNTWANNIFKKSTGSIFKNANSGTTFVGNIYQGTLGISIGSGNTSGNPGLVSNSDNYFGLGASSPAINASNSNYPAILHIPNIDDDASLLYDISGQSRPSQATLKDVGCDEFTTGTITNHPLVLTDVGPSYLGGPSTSAPTANPQIFCNSGTVGDLVATGTAIKWYSSEVSTTALSSGLTLVTGTYYVTQTVNNIESEKTAVAITRNNTAAPTAAPQTFCNLGTVSDLVANGTLAKWYSAATGGSALLTSTVLVTGNYYVSQTLNNCESERTLVSVIRNNTAAPTASTQTFCNSATVSDLVANGVSIKWYSSVSGSVLTPSTVLVTGTYFVSQTLNNCESEKAAVSVIVNSAVEPTFTAITPICSGAALSSLPTTSNNGYTGTWSPALDNSATTTYTFTPSAGQCATTPTLTITVNAPVTPTFTAVSPICAGASLSALPTTSNNGYNGTWSPALNNTATTTYTFTPTAGQCAVTTTLTITVNATPTFSAVSPICSGTTLATLPTTSNNGYTGTWSPAIDNTATTEYTFTPTSGQCAASTTLTITVNPFVTPTFTAVDPIFTGTPLNALPTTSNNGITGTWSPALDNTSTTTYTFTPTAGQCATTATLTITVNSNITPTFTAVSAICSGDVLSALSTTSNNGITGTWSPGLNNTATTTYTFTPEDGQFSTTTTLTITVNPILTPSVSIAITSGAQIACAGTSLTFTASPTNGGTPSYQWKVNGNNAGTNSATFISSTLVNGDAVTVVMTSNGIPCLDIATATSNAIAVTVNSAITASVSIASLCGESSATFTATPANGGSSPVYQWKINGNNVGTNSDTFTSSTLANNDQVTVVMASSASPCLTNPSVTSNTITVILNPELTTSVSIAITSGTQTSCAGTSVTFTATPTNEGEPSYQWKVNGTNAGTNIATFTSSTLADNDVVKVEMATTAASCWLDPTVTSNAITVGINPLNTITLTSAAGSNNQILCNPSNFVNITYTTTSATGATFSGLPAGLTGSWSSNVATISGTPTESGSFNYSVNLTGGCGTVAASGTITVNTNVTPTFTPVASICAGASLSALPTTSNNGYTGTWAPALNNAETTEYTFTPTAGQCATTASLTISVIPYVTPTFTAVAAICSGASLSALPTISNNEITGTWSPALNNTATTEYTFTPTAGQCATTATLTITINPNIAPTFTAVAAICNGDVLSELPILSNNGYTGTWSPVLNNTATTEYTFTPTAGQCATTTTLTITVNAILTPSVSIAITSGAQTSCAGTSLRFTATPTNGGTPSYQWKVNGNNAGTNSATFISSTLVNGDAVTVVMTSNGIPCLDIATATSNAIAVTVNSAITASVSIASLCGESSATFTATPANGGSSPVYQWKINGNNVGTNSDTFTSSTLANNDHVTVVMASSASPCLTNPSVTSNTITVILNPELTTSVSIAITSGTQTSCAGTSVTFTATPINGGEPSYQWKVNGTNAGTNSATFTSSTLADNDVVKVEMATTAASCWLDPTVTSNAITVGINPLNTITLTSAAGSNNQSLCNPANFASITYATTAATGATFSGLPAGVTGSWSSNVATISGTPTESGSFNYSVNLTGGCGTVAASGTITVNTNVTPTFTPVASICAGASLSALPTTSNNGYTGTWAPALNNTQTTTYTFTPTAGECANSTTLTITVVPYVTPTFAAVAAICAGGTLSALPTTSNNGITGTWAPALDNTATTEYTFTPAAGQCGTTATLTITVNPNITPTFTAVAAICDGDVLSALPTTSNNGYTGTWSPVLDNTATTEYTFTPTAGQCATTTTLTITVNPILTPSVSIAITDGTQTSCVGTSVTFTATPTNGGTPSYQWKVNGNNVGDDSTTFTSSSLTDNDAVTVVMTSNASPCLANATATSNAIIVTVNPTITASVSIASSCGASSATFTATPVSGGSTPTYQWKINGNNVGTNSATFTTSTAANNDQVTVVMASSASPCLINPSVTSNTITVILNPELTTSVSIAITAGTQTSCTGTSVTFTATPTNGGEPSYQWKVNGTNAGTNSATFTSSTLANNDEVKVEMTSTAASCWLDPTVTSNTITVDVNPLNTITLTSASTSNNQSLCNPANFASITYATTAATGADFSGLPAGVTGSWDADVATISGTPTVNGTFNYTVTLTGGCGTVTATGTIGTFITTWTVTSGVGSWSNGAPTASVGAVISGNYAENVDLNACTLTVNNNAVVSVVAGKDFHIAGAVTVETGSSLTVEHNANLLQDGTANANSGEITAKRVNSSMRRLDYTYWSSPTAKSDYSLKMFSPMTISPISLPAGGVTGASRFYYINETTNAFVAVEPTTTYFDDENIARGWSIRAPNNFPTNGTTATFNANWIGKPNSGDITIAATFTGSGKGSNLIGNPYPSTIDTDAFLTYSPDNGATLPNAGTIYFWTHTTQNAQGTANYASCNLSGKTAASAGGPTPNGKIQVGQGFILKKATSSTVVFNNAMRVGNNEGQFFKTATIERNRIWLNLAVDTTPLNQIMVGYIEGTTLGFDDAYDGKLINSASSISSIIDNENYVIQARPTPFVNTDEVPLNFNATTAGSYTLSLDHVDGLFLGEQNVYLKDNLLNSIHDIKASAYTFTSDQGTFSDRFDVVYNNSTLNISTPTFDANSVIVYKDDNKVLNINAGKVVMKNVKIYDVRGRLVYEKSNINTTTTALKDLKAEQEVLLVKITSDDNKVVTKKVVF